MTALILSPDYASHYSPLSVLARSLAVDDGQVVVATGLGLRDRVEADGFAWRPLVLGRGRNDGGRVVDASIGAFIAATRRGMVATLMHQAAERRQDLLWEPDRVVDDVCRLLDDLDPTTIIVDHVSLASTLAMLVSGRTFTTLVPGHPSQLPVGDECFGVPVAWPSAFSPDPAGLDELRSRCERAAEIVTDEFARVLDAAGRPVPRDAFGAHGHEVLYPWPASFHDPRRAALLPAHRDVGPLVRDEALRPRDEAWLRLRQDLPLVLVALGTFLSARVDVLRVIVAGLRRVRARVVLAVGDAAADGLGPLPEHVLVDRFVPQVAFLRDADVMISHGGGGTVGEAMAAGAAQLVAPFSTDQFAIAAEVERLGVGCAVDPNALTATQVAEHVTELLGGAYRRAVTIQAAESIRTEPSAPA